MTETLKKSPMPKIRIKVLRRILIYSVIIVGIFSAGYLIGNSGYSAQLEGKTKVTISRELPPDQENLEFSLFWRVWDTLQKRYFDKDKLIESQLVYGAIQGMVAAVGDPYTVFLPPSENKVVQEDLQGSFEGVGIQIGFIGTQLSVISPLTDSPAEKAGVKAGDFIIGISDEQKGIDRGTIGITLPEAVKAIRGKAGTIVTLALLRDDTDEPIIVDVERAVLDIPSVEYTLVGEEENIALIKLFKFSGETMQEWEEIVIEILKDPSITGIIIDLRNNPGGFLQGAVDLASEFLESGSVVVIEEISDGSSEELKVERIGRLRNRDVIVLVNGGSASASEILAGALRDIKEVKLVGETTFGKGTIQEPQQVDNGAGLHITIARWLTPSGYWVNEGGLVPDYEVENDPETEEDEQLLKAIEILGTSL